MAVWDVLMRVGLVVGCYLLGAIPMGYVLGRARGIDIRAHGSGATGATNALRTLGKGPSAVVFLFDVLKGLGPVLAIRLVLHEPALEVACGLAIIIGHNWPVYIGFRGGRGISPGVGALIGLAPIIGGGVLVLADATMAATRYVSLGSMVGACASFPAMLCFVLFLDYPPLYMVYATVGPAIVVWRHRGNIRRLLSGTERRIGQRVKVGSEG